MKPITSVLAVTAGLLAVSLIAFNSGNFNASFPARVEEAWANFKLTHNKAYATPVEHNFRKAVFLKNFLEIEMINANPKYTFKAAVFHHADLTLEEKRARYTGARPELNRKGPKTPAPQVGLDQLQQTPDIDWVAKGVVSPIQNQGQCGSCWAFSSTSNIESVNACATGKLLKLSEQQFVDCSSGYGNMGCNGGWMDNAFQYAEVYGDESENAYPYTATTNSCKYQKSAVIANIVSYKDQPSCPQVMNALQTSTVSVAIAVVNSFYSYASGIYNDATCNTAQIDHAIVITGWKNNNGSPYWIVRNSWGTSWGQAGYIWMTAGPTAGVPNGDICHICEYATQATPGNI